MMKLEEIADLLADFRHSKEMQREIRAELVRVAVEVLGIPQAEAVKSDVYAMLDGYLIAQGMRQEYRNGQDAG